MLTLISLTAMYPLAPPLTYTQVASVFPASVPMPNPVNLDHMAPPDIGPPGFLQRVPSGDARPAPGSHSGSDAPSGTPPPGQAGGHGLSLAGVNLS